MRKPEVFIGRDTICGRCHVKSAATRARPAISSLLERQCDWTTSTNFHAPEMSFTESRQNGRIVAKWPHRIQKAKSRQNVQIASEWQNCVETAKLHQNGRIMSKPPNPFKMAKLHQNGQIASKWLNWSKCHVKMAKLHQNGQVVSKWPSGVKMAQSCQNG